MSKLPPLPHWCESGSPFAEKMQAYAIAATEPLLQRIAHLEATASANYGRGHADAHLMLSERIAELERQPVGDDILIYLKGVYAFIESTCPTGFSNEVFRLPTTPTRSQELLLHLIQGDKP